MIGVLAASLIGQSCIAQTYVAPVQYQSYAQNYNQAYVEKTAFIAVEYPQTYISLVGTQQRQAERQTEAQQVQSTTEAKIDRLAAIVEALQKRLETVPNEQPQSLLPPKPAPANAPQSSGSEAVPLPPTVTQASLPVRAHVGLETLTRACAGCHQGTAKAGGGVVLFAADGSFTARDRDDLERIESAIVSGRMPKRAKQPMSLKEYVAIREFLNEQAGGLALNTNPREKTR